VLSPESAFLINNILSDESGKGRPESWNKFLSIPGRVSASKTGTSTGREGNITHPHDVWTIGHTPQRTALIWMGNNKGWEGNPKGFLRDDASGLTNAATPWKEIMIASHKKFRS
jgi:membrane peptidoglycan carboxypeptidase